MDKDQVEESYSVEMVDYMLSNDHGPKLSFADVMQFSDFGPKLGLNQEVGQLSENNNSPSMQEQGFCAGGGSVDGGGNEKTGVIEVKINRRKRPRSMKTTEEVESQRMTHIAVERNRRRQMNEHLRVLRSLMPGSYVQRGDQASMIGGAIEFVRELEQLLQCLESQKRRRLYGGNEPPNAPPPLPNIQQHQQPFYPSLPLDLDPSDEDTAENKSCLADIEVRVLGYDAMIKILSRRRHGQLIKIIAALQDLQFNILHTNITTIEQTVLYSFNVKMKIDTKGSGKEVKRVSAPDKNIKCSRISTQTYCWYKLVLSRQLKIFR